MPTPNMGLVLPVVSSTPGPLYASENNQAFSVIDAHDHSPGSGVPIPSVGISLNADLPFNGNNATLLRSTRYVDQVAPISLGTDLGCLYISGGNLYYNNGIGQQIQITAGAALNATSIGGIGGDYSTSTASVFYTSISQTFTFWSDANTTANIDGGPLTIRNNTANSFGVTISADPSISGNYGLTLPQALPGAIKIMTLDAAGNIAAVYDVDNSTIVVATNVIKVPAQGITNVQIANNTILPGNLDPSVTTFINPPGIIQMWGGVSAPAGWLLCDGTAVSRTTYSALYSAVGDAFGNGDTTTTFNIPDMRGRFPRGVDSGAGRDPDTASRTAMNSGGNTADNVGSVQTDQFGAHGHNYVQSNGINGGANIGLTGPVDGGFFTTQATQFAGGNETRPINAYVNFIIKF